MRLAFPLVVSALLFAMGVFGVLVRRNTVLVLMSVELMLNAANLNLVAFDAWWSDTLHGGQVMTLFVITIAAAEVGLGLAIVLMVFRTRGTSDLYDLGLLNERAETERLAEFDGDGDGPQPDLRSDAGSPDVTEPEAAR